MSIERLLFWFFSLSAVSAFLGLVVWMVAKLVRIARVQRLRHDLVEFFLCVQGNEQARRCVWATSQPDGMTMLQGWGPVEDKVKGEYAAVFKAWRKVQRTRRG